MSLNTLFLQPPEIDPWDYLPEGEARKVAGVKLTSPPSYWSDEITQTLIRDNPYIPSERVIVNFKRRDDAGGHAVGFIGIVGAPKVSIPVVIVNRELKPLDILIVRSTSTDGRGNEQAVGDQEDQVLPLTEDTFSNALDTGEIGTPVNDADIRGSGWTEDGSSLRLPMRGRTVLASVMGATEAQKEAFGKLLQDKSVLAGLAAPSLGNTSLFLQANDIGAKTASATRTVAQVVDAWLNAPVPGDGVRVKMASAPIKRAEALIFTGSPVEVGSDQFLSAEVCDLDGQFKGAVSFMAVDLTNPIKDLERWMLFEDGGYCRAPTKVAVANPEVDQDALCQEVLSKVATRSLQRGTMVSFLLHDEGTTRFTAPAKLAAIATNEAEGSIHLQLADAMGRAFPVVLARGVKVAMFDPNTATWVLPIDSEVLQLNGDREAGAMAPEKVAHLLQQRLPDSLMCAGGQFTLTIDGQVFNGITQQGEAKTAQVLNDWFENGAELLEAAKESGFIRFRSDLHAVQEEITKQASYYTDYPAVARALVKDLAMPLAKVTKLAAAIGDPEGADALLSTGFLTEDNLSEFVGMGGQFEEVVSKLARLLLAVRLGFPGDESAIVVAMKSLQRVAERLSTAVQEVGA